MFPRLGRTILAIFLLFGAAHASAATNVNLKGSVVKLCSVSLVASPNAAGMDFTTSQTDFTIATVTENCNDKSGYKVTLKTANGSSTGLCKGAAKGNKDTLSYAVAYGGTSVAFSKGSARVTNAAGRTPDGGAVKPITVAWTGNPSLTVDTYSDTLTVTLSAN